MADKATVDAYDTYADAYDEGVAEFWRDFPADLFETFKHTAPGVRLLNLGSGSGRDAVRLRDYGFEVHCVDASPSMIAMTKELGFDSYLRDFTELSFEQSSFDAVWAYCSLMHISTEAMHDVLWRVRTMMKSHGVLLCAAIEGSSSSAMVSHDIMPGKQRYFRFYQDDELRDIIESCGFQMLTKSARHAHGQTYLQQLFRRT